RPEPDQVLAQGATDPFTFVGCQLCALAVEGSRIVVAQHLSDQLLRTLTAAFAVQVDLFSCERALDAGADQLLGLVQELRHGSDTSSWEARFGTGGARASLRSRGRTPLAGRKSWSNRRRSARA